MTAHAGSRVLLYDGHFYLGNDDAMINIKRENVDSNLIQLK
jgi:hypothetical protein